MVNLNERPDTKRTGLYFLSGPDPEKAFKERVYIGESDNVFKRLMQHDRDENKDFWSRAIAIATKDDNLTKAHVRYLESRMIELTVAAGRAILANGTAPDRPALPEPDIADMEYFLSQVRLVLPVLGFNFTEPVGYDPSTADGENVKDAPPLFEMSPVGTTARAKEMRGRFIVLKGSTARKQGISSWSSYRSLRDQLVQDGKLGDSPDSEYFVFNDDVEFASPSAAAAVVFGGNQNGRMAWRVVETGQTYKDWQEQRLREAGVGDTESMSAPD